MPTIKEFNAPSLGLVPSEVGVEATAAAARRIGAFSNQAANAMERVGQRAGSAIRDAGDVYAKYKDHQEISAGAALGAKMFDGLIEDKDNLVKSIDPTDPLYGQKVEGALKQWRDEKLEPALQKFGEGFTTERSQNWAEHFVDQTRQHMFHQTAADTSTAAGIGVLNGVKTFANEATNTALRDSSFSTVDTQLGLAEHAIGGMVQSSPMKGIAGAKVQSEVLERTREQIVKAGAVGAIQKADDPESVAQQWIKKYPKYINGTEALQLAREARQQIRAARADQAYQDHQAKVQQEDLSDRTSRNYEKLLFSDDPAQQAKVSVKAIYNDPRITRKDADHLRIIIEQETKPQAVARVSNKTTMEMLPDIRSGKIVDSDPIYKAMEEGKLNRADLGFLRKELEERRTPQGEQLSKDRSSFFGKYAQTFDVGKAETGQASALGLQNSYRAEMDARRQEDVLRRAGRDPHLVYDPRSEFFFGKPDNMRKYQATMKETTDYEAALRKGGAKAPEVAPFQPAVSTFNERFQFDANAPVKEISRPVPPAAVQMLRNNPSMRSDFDAKYGTGSAARILDNK